MQPIPKHIIITLLLKYHFVVMKIQHLGINSKMSEAGLNKKAS